MCVVQCWQRKLLLECNCTDEARVSLFPNSLPKCIENAQNECTKQWWDEENEFLNRNCQSESPLEYYSESFDATY